MNQFMANNKYTINFTPTGLITTKEMTAHIPVSPDEIVAQVIETAELGQHGASACT